MADSLHRGLADQSVADLPPICSGSTVEPGGSGVRTDFTWVYKLPSKNLIGLWWSPPGLRSGTLGSARVHSGPQWTHGGLESAGFSFLVPLKGFPKIYFVSKHN